jgi:hypothetical protein
VHVVYAIPLDGQDNSATVAPQIAADIDEVTAWWQREDPSHQPRFDFYSAPCGPQLDITFLKTSTISVGMTEAHQVHALLWNEIQNQPGATYTKFIVFLDGVNPVNVCGTGGTTQGAALGDVAMGLAVVYLDSCNGASQASVAAHEFLHSIAPAGGLVGAPHTCPGDLAHVCDSSGDVLYPYAEAGIPLNSLQLDVGHDDYYAGTAPVNLQVVPWLRAVQDQVHLTLNVSGEGTVASDVPGVSCAAPCGSDWDRGSSVELNATPTASDRFVRWDGACDGNGSCPLTLTQAAHVTAVFGPLRIPLQVSTLGRGRITCSPACTKTFTAGYFLELKAVAAKGWRFARWSGGCAGTRPLCRPPTDFALNVKATFRKRSGI